MPMGEDVAVTDAPGDPLMGPAARDGLATALTERLMPAPTLILEQDSEVRIHSEEHFIGAYLHVVGQVGLHLLLDHVDDLTVDGDSDLDRCVETYFNFVARYLTATIEVDVRRRWPASTAARFEFADGSAEGLSRMKMDKLTHRSGYAKFLPRRIQVESPG
jgi:hypothetical protein